MKEYWWAIKYKNGRYATRHDGAPHLYAKKVNLPFGSSDKWLCVTLEERGKKSKAKVVKRCLWQMSEDHTFWESGCKWTADDKSPLWQFCPFCGAPIGVKKARKVKS